MAIEHLNSESLVKYKDTYGYIKRHNTTPIDDSFLFFSYEEAVAYANQSNGLSYAGQIIGGRNHWRVKIGC